MEIKPKINRSNCQIKMHKTNINIVSVILSYYVF